MKLDEVQIICISLAKRPDRWARISSEARLANMSIIRVDAVDASTFVAHQHPAVTLATAHNIYFKTRRSNYEIDAAGAVGCSLSHFKVWEDLLKADPKIKATLVFEDDASIPVNLKEKLIKVLSVIPPDWDILQLQRTKFGGGVVGCKPIKDDNPWQLCTSLIGTHAYIVSRQGAQKLLKKAYPIELHVDAFMAYMARMEYIRMIWHPLIDIQPRADSGSNISHGNARICSVPTNMDDRSIVALSIPTIVGIMLISAISGGILAIATRKSIGYNLRLK
jgi:GR25 family glycosyltransferase involved in LPS biosynthesis